MMQKLKCIYIILDSSFYHTAFLESCYVYNIVPRGLHIFFIYKKPVYKKLEAGAS